MKSNEERVNNILKKAKHYKSVRNKMISGVTISLCAVVAIMTHVNFNTKINNYPNMTQTLNDKESLIVAKNDIEEKELPTFKSKEDLISRLKENAEKDKINIFGDLSFGVTEDLAESVQSSDALGAVRNEVLKEAEDNSYSETNTQVQGVDESDIVKTNGKNIFYLSNNDNKIRIFDTQFDEIKLVKEIELSDRVYNGEMYIDDKYMVVLTNSEMKNDENEKADYYNYRACTKVLIYDINTYEKLRELETEGNIVSSRKVDDDIYIVTNKYISFYKFNEDTILPIYRDTCASGEYTEIPATEIKYFEGFEKDEECNYMIVTSFSLSDMESKVNINTYLGAGNEIYCSRENLYVTKANYERQNSFSRLMVDLAVISDEDNTTTSIHKFAIDDGDIKYVATGKVDGRLLNQFSMDEYDGYFRITTTDNVTGNNLFVLDEKLEKVGSVENLAKGERIYSTRFMGDKAYVVTYKTVDPLFVIDLSNPRVPKVLGELKIPGYSSYLHPLGENYLIGFGEDSVEKSYLNWEGEQEVTAYSTGLKMAIFDVSDYNNPKELHSIKIGGRGSYSELLYNHKALLFNEEKGIIAFPASITSEAGKYDNGVPMYGETIFNGALVYNISAEDGISLRGKISHSTANKYRNNIERILYIGNKLYTVSMDMIQSSDINTIEKIDDLKF